MPDAGAGSLSERGKEMSLACRLDECDLIDFSQCRKSAPYAIERRLTEELHPFLLCQLANFRTRLLFENHFSDRVSEIEQLVNRGSSAIACAPAFDAAGTFAEIEVAPLSKIESACDQRIFLV